MFTAVVNNEKHRTHICVTEKQANKMIKKMECVEQVNFIKSKNNLSKYSIIQVPLTQKYHRNGAYILYTEWTCSTDYLISYLT